MPAPASPTPMPARREPQRRRLSATRAALTHKFKIGEHEGYITAGMYEDGTLGEIFFNDIGKEGSTLNGMVNACAMTISVALQYGVPLETIAAKYTHMRFDPSGDTDNPRIPTAKSIPDYAARWLASIWCEPEVQAALGIRPDPAVQPSCHCTSSPPPATAPTPSRRHEQTERDHGTERGVAQAAVVRHHRASRRRPSSAGHESGRCTAQGSPQHRPAVFLCPDPVAPRQPPPRFSSRKGGVWQPARRASPPAQAPGRPV
jgi:hypothetical protein